MPSEHFDAVVVGSGFGGSVMACRLAEAGLRVCLLERGKAYPPGSFPRTPRGLKRNFWDPSEGFYGMFNVWSFRDLEAVVSSALGGGSIIYANVLLRKDEKWFVREDPGQDGYEYWPVTREELDPHYDAVEAMLNAQRYPFDHAPYSETPKTRALKEAAEQLDLDWHLPKLAVTFANDGEDPVPGEPIREPHGNLHGRTRTTCRLCAECDAGCNYGSKNTLDYNYLSAAERHGADIRTLCEVKRFAPRDGGGYSVGYVRHDLDREDEALDTSALPLETITTDRLVLSAGTLGSTYLLLNNRAALPGLSPQLGNRFCGNGDLLSFAYRCCEEEGGAPRVVDPNYGPVITSTIRKGDALDGASGRGFYIQDAGYPAFLSWVMESINVMGATRRFLRFVRQRVWDRLTDDPESDLSGEVQDILGDVASSTTVPLLGMGRDRPTGHMRLKEDEDGTTWLDVDWQLEDSQDYFDRLRDTMKDIADAWHADFIMNPTWMLRRVITVHPLGGCPMGRSKEEGVVDAYGEVFGHPDLYVADGSVMPGPVGPNPALTIAALSNRFADRIIEKAEGPPASRDASAAPAAE